jgi:DDE superfamily endonuclease
LVLDGAPNHRCGDLAVLSNITLLFLPPYAPELNPKENLWDEIREKILPPMHRMSRSPRACGAPQSRSISQSSSMSARGLNCWSNI